MDDFTLHRVVAAPYDETLRRVRTLLADAGFGVLTEIDVRATLAEKLGVEVPPRVILGACRPELAQRALEADPRIATMLPCNVVVAAREENTSDVEVFDPAAMTAFTDVPEVATVAAEARDRLAGMLKALDGDEEAA